MISKRLPFFFVSIFQGIKIGISFSFLLLFSGFGSDLSLIIIQSEYFSAQFIFFASDFALLALFVYGIAFPHDIMKHSFIFNMFKLFAVVGSISLLVITIVRRMGIDAELQIVNNLNRRIIYLIILIFIDFMVLFVLLLYKGEFKQIRKELDTQNKPEFNETFLEED